MQTPVKGLLRKRLKAIEKWIRQKKYVIIWHTRTAGEVNKGEEQLYVFRSHEALVRWLERGELQERLQQEVQKEGLSTEEEG